MRHDPDWYNISLKVFLKDKTGKILALKADEKSNMAGFYDFPGGRINPEEFNTDYADIIKRELAEEIGLNLKYKLILKPISFARHHYFSKRQNKEIRILFLCFEADYLGGDSKISHEHVGHAWLDLHNIKIEDYFILGCLEAVKRYIAP